MSKTSMQNAHIKAEQEKLRSAVLKHVGKYPAIKTANLLLSLERSGDYTCSLHVLYGNLITLERMGSVRREGGPLYLPEGGMKNICWYQSSRDESNEEMEILAFWKNLAISRLHELNALKIVAAGVGSENGRLQESLDRANSRMDRYKQTIKKLNAIVDKFISRPIGEYENQKTD